MAEPTVGDFYANTYLTTHLQRFQQSQMMVSQDMAQQFAIAQLYAQQIEALNKQIEDINGAATTDELTKKLKVYGLQQQVISDTQKRQIQVIQTVDDMYSIDSSLASINTSAEQFANSLATAGTIESKTSRYAGTVGGYTQGSEQAKAVAAAMYQNFRNAAYNKGYQSTFDANDSKIRYQIATKTGVDPSDIDTVQAQKDKKLKDMMAKQGQQAVGSKELAELRALADGSATPGQKASVIDDLLAQRVQLSERQLQAIERASLTPEEQMQRSREIYRTQFAPKSKSSQMRQSQEFQSYFNTLPPELQMITIGFNKTTEDDVKFMKGKRAEVEGDLEKAVAFDLYYALEKDRRAGKQPAYQVHKKVEQYFPDDEEAQQRVLGYIFRHTANETGRSISKARKKQDAVDEILIENYGRTAPSDEELFDAIARQRLNIEQNIPAENPIIENPPPVEVPASGSQTDDEEKPKEEAPPPPPEPVVPQPVLYTNPSWYDAEATVYKTNDGGFNVTSPKYGTFTLDASGNLTSGSIKRGSAAGHFSDLSKTKPKGE